MKSPWTILALALTIISCQKEDILQTISVPLNKEFTIKENQQGRISFAEPYEKVILKFDSTKHQCIPPDQFPKSSCIVSYSAKLYFSIEVKNESTQFILKDGAYYPEPFAADTTIINLGIKDYKVFLKDLIFEDLAGRKKKTAHLLIQDTKN